MSPKKRTRPIPTAADVRTVQAFRNFLTWAHGGPRQLGREEWPPAVYAYRMGVSAWCPPLGEW